MPHFFISYTNADHTWAEWIAWTLESAGHTTTIQAWDFRPGGNFVVEMQRAAANSDRTVAVLSPDYLRSLFAMAEWAAAFAADPDGSKGKLVPVLVREASLDGLLAPSIYIKLVGLLEAAAREALIRGLAIGRAKPTSVPPFPGARPFPGPATAPSDPEAALDALPVDEVPPPGPLPAGSRMPLSHNPLFVGREEDLKTLARQLKAGETSAVGQVETAAATGLGGIGKTQLASEFVHRYGQFFAGGVFWMSFADAAAVPIEVADCGRSLNLLAGFDALTLEQQVRLVEEAWRSTLPRLLVFDNCEEQELLRRWRPRFGKARVLVTSRRPEWDPALGVKTVPLTTLPRPASIELLRRFRPDVPETEPALIDIADELGDLPLALHLAGSFIKIYRASSFGQPAAYLKTLRQKDLLEHPSLQGRGSSPSPTGHEGHVGRTFALSFKRLDPADVTDTLALALLVRAAWFALGEPIPRSLLLETAHLKSEDLTADLLAEDALRRLTDLGLIEANDENNLLMHRLVGVWMRGVVEDDEARISIEEVILGKATMLNRARNPADLLPLQPHLRAVTDRAIDRKDRMAARLCDELGSHLWWTGDYSGARLYLEKAVALHREVTGAGHPDTASSLNSLGRLHYSQGDFPMARLYWTQSLEVRENILGPEHPDTADSLSNLGTLLNSQGDFGQARPFYERALAIRNKILGPEHPNTASSLYNIGILLSRQGDFDQARSYEERALAIREKILGPEHPDTASSLYNLGILLNRQGDFDQARSYEERALAIREKILGPEHPDTASSLDSLGNILRRQYPEQARSYYERALAICEKVLGPEHPDTASSLNNLGVLFMGEGDPEQARSYYKRALAIYEKTLGPEHPYTAGTSRNLDLLPRARRPKNQRPKKKS